MREIFQNWVEQLRGQFSTMRDVELQLFARLIEALVTYGEFRMSDPDIPGNLKEVTNNIPNHITGINFIWQLNP
jgi:hypothetical protein